MKHADIGITNGLVTAYNFVIGGMEWEETISDVEVPDDFDADWWEGKWAYDAETGAVSLSGIEKPPTEPWPEPTPDPVEELRGLLAALMEGVNGDE